MLILFYLQMLILFSLIINSVFYYLMYYCTTFALVINKESSSTAQYGLDKIYNLMGDIKLGKENGPSHVQTSSRVHFL